MRDELLINGMRVDLDSTTISLEYVNNILSSIDKITSSKSYTISLPLTLRNEMVFDQISSVSHQSVRVGVYLDAEYRRNGIIIIRNAKAYVTAVADKSISICLIWDAMANYTQWLKSDKKIAEVLPSTQQWNGTADLWMYHLSNLLYEASYDQGVSSVKRPPVINFGMLVRSIMNSIGLTWNSTEIATQLSDATNLAIPMTTFAGGFANNQTARFSDSRIQVDQSQAASSSRRYYLYLGSNVNTTAFPKEISSSGIFTLNGNINKVKISANIKFCPAQSNVVISNSTKFTVYGLKSDMSWSKVYEKALTNVSGSWNLTVINQEIDVSSCTGIILSMTGMTTSSDVGIMYWGSGFFHIVPSYPEASTLYDFPVTANAPDIKQVDIIKAFCALYGLSIVSDKDGTIHFASWDKYKDTSSAVDWTYKLVNYNSVPNEIRYKVGDYCKNNRFMWLEDDDRVAKADTDGVLYCKNETLEESKDILTLPFAASYGNSVTIATEKDSKVETVDVKPRLLRAVSNGSRTTLEWNDTLSFTNIIQTYYETLQSILDYPIEIKVYAYLNELDFARLDMTKPVYLAQTGQYYCISKIATDNQSYISEVTLIQL